MTKPVAQMTGLNPDTDQIIEIACLITDGHLNLVDQDGLNIVVSCPKERLDAMDEWCTVHHGESGLTKAALDSTVTPGQAAFQLLEYIKKYIPSPRVGILAGNSVHVDRLFLSKGPYKTVHDHIHYRILDVSAINEAAKRWCPREVWAYQPQKTASHRAKGDILESIEQARYFKKFIFQPAVTPSMPLEQLGGEKIQESRDAQQALHAQDSQQAPNQVTLSQSSASSAPQILSADPASPRPLSAEPRQGMKNKAVEGP